MGYYFEDRQSAEARVGSAPEQVIRLMAERYMGDHPETAFVWRTFDESGIACDRKGGYIFDFAQRFPEGETGETAYALGDLYCPSEKSSGFLLRCFGPSRVWLNGESVFVSNGAQERDGTPAPFTVRLNAGFNRFLIRCERTPIGFGCVLQNAMPQWEPCNYIMPFAQRRGEAGFLFTAPVKEELSDLMPLFGSDEEKSGLRWLPENRLPGCLDGEGCFYARTRAEADRDAEIGCLVLCDGKRPDKEGVVPSGSHELLMYGTLDELRSCLSTAGLRLQSLVPAHGRCTDYLVLGPCSESAQPEELLCPGAVYQNTVWQPDLKNMFLRPYVETELFGRWSYPLGVTLYGLLSAGRLLNEQKYTDYAHTHARQVTGIHDYALWDRERFGFPGVNQQLCWLDALDDCGSFGSFMLEEDGGRTPPVRRIADRIAVYMIREQPKMESGAFCRRDDTVWADDMYMSVPFLCRYAAMSGSREAEDLCVKELLLYRELLFMPQKKLMAHMMSLRHGKNNQIPWCRGNGWVIFSLSELLLRLGEHAEKEKLVSFFRELTEGYLSTQGETGLWHQVLDDPETYPEASGTAMFICAFCRGLRLGLYDDETAKRAGAAVKKAWKGLAKTVIDQNGGLYGVCRGSGFSFSRTYYRSLMWRFNDAHGIGIVMLAGTEMLKTGLAEQ